MRPSSGRPIGFFGAFAAELRFLYILRKPGIIVLTIGAFAVNWLVNDRGRLLITEPFMDRWLFAIVWAGFIWSGERPKEREHFYGAPMSSAGHELARVLAGAVLLMLPIAAMLVGEDLHGNMLSPHSMGVGYTVASFTGTLTLYLLTSCLALASAWPTAWLLGSFLCLDFLIFASRTPLGHALKPMLGIDGWGFLGAITPVRPARLGQGQPSYSRIPWEGAQWPTTGPVIALWLMGALALVLLVAYRRSLSRRLRPLFLLAIPVWSRSASRSA